MARKKIAAFTDLWARHESLYIDVFSKSLINLSKKDNITGDEHAISAMLCPILTRICYELSAANNMEIRPPDWELPVPPKDGSNPASSKKQKRPDFTCNCINTNCYNVEEEYMIPFHVECKRIGNPTSTSWKLNKQYVISGISRFDSSLHEYGKYASSGLMIGYIIDMPPDIILEEINSYQSEHLSSLQQLAFTVFEGLSITVQRIYRISVIPEDFKLHHLWIDLRQRYNA